LRNYAALTGGPRRLLRQLFARLLAHHVLGVPIWPVRVGLPDALRVLAVRGRNALARSFADAKVVVAESMRPASRCLTSCSNQPLPSGSVKETKEL
jgi:hypothetical protein